MILISSRKNYWDADDVSDFDEIRDVPNMDDTSLGTPHDEQWLQTQLTGKNILILIHGYNNLSDQICKAYSIIEKKFNSLKEPYYPVIVGYLWPGGDSKLEWWLGKNNAGAVSPRMTRWINLFHQWNVDVEVMTHSLGAKVILSALDDGNDSKLVKRLYLTAAAVDDESIEYNEKYFTATQKCQYAYVFHSKHDPVLMWAYEIAENDLALGLRGPEDKAAIVAKSPNVFVINCKRHVRDHGAWKRCDPIYDYINNSRTGNVRYNQYHTLL